MSISRRGFIGGIAAAFAMENAIAKTVKKAETPLLRMGILSDTHVSSYGRPGKPSFGAEGQTLKMAFEYLRKRGVDAVVMPGDLTDFGTLKELEVTGRLWKEAFPKGDKDDLGNPVEKLFIRGNHDNMGKDDKLDLLVRKDPAQVWKDVFGIDWYTEKVMLRQVKGYWFVLADWGVDKNDLDAFFAKNKKHLRGKKPFFYVQHAPPRGTVDTPRNGGSPCGGDRGDCTRILKNYPNAVALTGHSHFSVTLCDQTWQEDFLSIGCGCMQYIWNREGRDNSWSLGKSRGHAKRCSSAGRQGLYMLVYADRIVLERWDFVNFEKVGPDHVFPLDGTKPFSCAEQKKRARAPQFPRKAKLVIDERDFHYRVAGEKWIPERQVFVTVPRAEPCPYDEGRVYEYECTVFAEADGEDKPLLVRRELAGGYFLNDARVEETSVVAFGLDELPAGKKLRYAVRPMDDWGNRGNPIYADYRIRGK